MSKDPGERHLRPLSTAEKLGHVWGGIFLALVIILLITLLGKAFLTPG